MSESLDEAREVSGRSWRSSPAVRWGGFVVALGLLAASIYYAVAGGQGADFSQLWRARPHNFALLLAAVALSNVFVIGVLFWLVNRPFADPERPVGFWIMQGLIAASGLLNYTPFKAGLIGRVAYLKLRHGIGYRESVLIHLILAGLILAVTAAAAGVTIWRGGFDLLWWLGIALGVALIGHLGAVGLHQAIPRRLGDWVGRQQLGASTPRTARHMTLWAAISMGNLLIIAFRWWVVFRIFGHAVGPADAMFMAVVHTLSAAFGPANGLGLREWLIGLGAGAGFFGGDVEGGLQLGLAASVIDRAAEAIVLIPSGSAALPMLPRGGESADR